MDVLEIAKRLYDSGVVVTPVKGKAAFRDNWQKINEAPNGNFQMKGVSGVGVVTGKPLGGGYLGALDFDCFDEEINNNIAHHLSNLNGGDLVYRVGLKPKFLVPFICDEPLKKITVGKKGENHLEVLGAGQQFVAYGIHPDTGEPYEWYNGDFMNVEKFPRLDRAGVNRVCDLFRDAIGDYFDDGGDDGDDFDVSRPPLALSKAEVIETLKRHPASRCDYDQWRNAGFGLHHQFEGSAEGLAIFKQWSAKDADRYNEGECAKKWASYGTEGRGITFATVIRDAKLNSLRCDDIEVVKPKKAGLFTRIGPSVWESQHKQDWLVKGVIERKTLCAIYGAPKTGKSFIAIDMALHLAHGREWCGRRVSQGAVAYVAGEGVLGVQRRIAAWRLEYGIEGEAPFYLSTGNVVITDYDQRKALLKALDAIAANEPEGLGMIVLDTYARVLGGEIDENASSDTGKIVTILDKIKERYNCAVVIIHHSPKGGGGMRGSGALQGAVDTSMSVEKKGAQVQVRSQDSKDAAQFEDIVFRLIGYELPKALYVDNFDESVSTAIARYEPEGVIGNGEKLSPSGESVMQAVSACAEHPKTETVSVPPDVTTNMGLAAPTVAYCLSDVKDWYERQNPADEREEKKKRRVRFTRGIEDLKKKEVIIVLDDRVMIL